MPELQVVARYTVASGEESTVRALLSELARAVRDEEGNIAFQAYLSVDNEHEIVLLERYTSRDAFKLHRATDHFRRIVTGQLVPRLTNRVVELYDVLN